MGDKLATNRRLDQLRESQHHCKDQGEEHGRPQQAHGHAQGGEEEEQSRPNEEGVPGNRMEAFAGGCSRKFPLVKTLRCFWGVVGLDHVQDKGKPPVWVDDFSCLV